MRTHGETKNNENVKSSHSSIKVMSSELIVCDDIMNVILCLCVMFSVSMVLIVLRGGVMWAE